MCWRIILNLPMKNLRFFGSVAITSGLTSFLVLFAAHSQDYIWLRSEVLRLEEDRLVYVTPALRKTIFSNIGFAISKFSEIDGINISRFELVDGELFPGTNPLRYRQFDEIEMRVEHPESEREAISSAIANVFKSIDDIRGDLIEAKLEKIDIRNEDNGTHFKVEYSWIMNKIEYDKFLRRLKSPREK
jgi:hypothetical protein